jgi:hypothetical protein
MEKALLLSPSQADAFTAGSAEDCAALIVGSEFCQTQLPSYGTLGKLSLNFRGRIGLATSIMTDDGLSAWKKFLAGSARKQAVSEIVVNDWGFLALASAAKVPVSAGRLLIRELVKLEQGWTRTFIKKHGIVSAETDTPELAAQARTRLGLKVSFHPGSVFKAVTSYCPFEKHFKFACGRTCGKGPLKLASAALGFPLLLNEKAYFTQAPGRSAPRWAWRTVRATPPGGNRGGISYI